MNYPGRRFCSQWMAPLTIAVVAILPLGRIEAQDAAAEQYLESAGGTANHARMKWWREARFGMFVHWGLYSVERQKPWHMATNQVPKEEYEKIAERFNPDQFDAAAWVTLAKDAGMKYLVITTKHHDGFCLFDTAATDYDVVDRTPWGKDPMKMLSEECRRQDVRFCTYYSITDWHHPSQYPSDRPGARKGHYQFHLDQKDSYREYVKRQLTELIQQYDPGVIWFDGTGNRYDDWAPEDGREIRRHVESLNPGIITNGRGKVPGDFGTSEQKLPGQRMDRDWEACMTMNRNWSYVPQDKNWKSTTELIRMLAEVASKSGNFLLNVGPTPEGTIPQESIDRLKEIGRWMAINGESIYGTKGTPFEESMPWGVVTQKPDKLYLHVFDWPSDDRLSVPLLRPVTKAYLLTNPSEALALTASVDVVSISLSDHAPDSHNSVVVLQLQETQQEVTR